MLKQILTTLMLLACICTQAATREKGNWQMIPLPQQVQTVNGQPFVVSGKTTIQYANGDEKQKRNAEFLASYIKEMTGIKCATTTRKSNNQIRLAIANVAGGDESYRMNVNNKLINIEGTTHAGVFYALQTIMKALPVAKNAVAVELPQVNITDAPRFAYRAFMIDCGRHFFSVDYLKKLIDVFAMHNINYFHWHLTEDQGWRIAINKYPKLTEIGSVRSETTLGHNTGKYDGKPVTGYYTQEDAREIVRYAAERYMTVIPEVDMPGHIQSALAAYPELGCTGGPYDVCRDFGVIREVMCAGKPWTLAFAKDVINEIMDIFPSAYIHIGGDECPKERWKECKQCQAKIAELGLKDYEGHSKEDQLQTWFMGEVEKEIRARGRKMIGWDEILDGTPSKDITVIGWTSKKASVKAAKEGHPTVVAPITNFYFSNPRINQIKGIPSIERVYNLDPCQAEELSASEQKNVIGAEGCIWTEWVADSKKLEWELLPRLAALCEVQWTAKEQRNLDSFLNRMLHIHDIYRLKGLNYKEDIEEAVKTK